ncbi:MAG: hypothetical protein KF845_07895 [Cyclobacteriaceae bacterium]|nr:hypothetical protein [Cyclobacteriaceae bacterium]
MRSSYLILFFLIGCCLAACKQVPHHYAYSKSVGAAEPVVRPAILFVIFNMEQRDGITEMTIMDKKVVEGALKSAPESSTAHDRVYVAQLNKDKMEIAGFYMEHPLRKNVEYTNEANELTTKFVEFNGAEFFIRVSVNPDCVYLRLDDVRGSEVVKSFLFNLN